MNVKSLKFLFRAILGYLSFAMKKKSRALKRRPAPKFLDLARRLGPTIRRNVNKEENNSRLSPATVKILREAGFLKMYLPKSLGGFEIDPITAASVVEEIARHNTAAGWMLMVGNTTIWWTSRLPEQGIAEIYRNGRCPLIAGSIHPPMKATPVDGGYLINGRSKLVSNANEADWISVSALILEDGKQKTSNGTSALIAVFMKSKQCQIYDTWHSIGMKATDSQDVEATNVFVPEHLSYSLGQSSKLNRNFNRMLYRFPPFGASAACLIAPIALAIARNAINEVKMLARGGTPLVTVSALKDKGLVQHKLGLAEALVQSGRAHLHQVLSWCWNRTVDGYELSANERADLLLASTHATQSSMQAVDLMYSVAGTYGVYLKNGLAHYFMDAHVIRQHGFINESRYQTAAQVYFGDKADLPTITF